MISPCCFQPATGRTRISEDVPSGEPPKLEPAGELQLSNLIFFSQHLNGKSACPVSCAFKFGFGWVFFWGGRKRLNELCYADRGKQLMVVEEDGHGSSRSWGPA